MNLLLLSRQSQVYLFSRNTSRTPGVLWVYLRLEPARHNIDSADPSSSREMGVNRIPASSYIKPVRNHSGHTRSTCRNSSCLQVCTKPGSAPSHGRVSLPGESVRSLVSYRTTDSAEWKNYFLAGVPLKGSTLDRVGPFQPLKTFLTRFTLKDNNETATPCRRLHSARDNPEQAKASASECSSRGDEKEAM